ncbi:MAG TPA: hypothetical protein VNT79_10615 [Phycisphaerae bacterium]|nr:hypothetical protein [Phycisphaerae bacterium]
MARKILWQTGRGSLLSVLILWGPACDRASDNRGDNKGPGHAQRWVEEYGDHIREYEYKPGPGGEKIKHGKFVFKRKTGLVIAEGYYLDGKDTGLWRAWYDNGQLAFEGQYSFGMKDGEWVHWDEAGKETKRERWVKGQLLIPSAPAQVRTDTSASQPSATATEPTTTQPAFNPPRFGG